MSIAGPTIRTRGGLYFDLAEPRADLVRIEDIAHALSHICRFTGHTRFFYSVAQHSVLVSHLVPPELALQGLLHDAHEAYVGDVASPLKRLLPDYKAVEGKVEAAVRQAFGLPLAFHPDVKRADLVALRTEQRDCMGNADLWSDVAGIEPHPDRIQRMPPFLAMAMFLGRFREVTQHGR